MPHSGGYIVWVHNAFGPMASLLNGMANLLCNIFDCALYPLLLTEYLERALLPLLPPEPHGGGAAGWLRLAPDLVGSLLRVLLVGIAACVNVLGTNIVGIGAGVLMVIVTLPIGGLVIAAYSSPEAHPLAPFDPSLQNYPQRYTQVSFFAALEHAPTFNIHTLPGGTKWSNLTVRQAYFFATLVLWNTCGYDSAGMVAAEVADGQRTYPAALSGAVVLTSLTYLVRCFVHPSSVHTPCLLAHASPLPSAFYLLLAVYRLTRSIFFTRFYHASGATRGVCRR